MTRTTAKHFRIFSAECRRLAELWELSGWRIMCRHTSLAPRVFAQCTANVLQRDIVIDLAVEWPESREVTDGAVRSEARHEMIHALLNPLGGLMGCRFVSEDEANSAEHEVLRRLDRLLPR